MLPCLRLINPPIKPQCWFRFISKDLLRGFKGRRVNMFLKLVMNGADVMIDVIMTDVIMTDVMIRCLNLALMYLRTQTGIRMEKVTTRTFQLSEFKQDQNLQTHLTSFNAQASEPGNNLCDMTLKQTFILKYDELRDTETLI
ncbi:hypothetical protein ABVT39_019077 [Epinephelus coioides]